MSTGRLILTPEDPFLRVAGEPLIELLQELELCGQPLPNQSHAFSVGDAFMRWISFAGCSPFVRFEPESDQDEAFCHIRLRLNEGDQPLFLYGINSKPPACPLCRKTLTDWKTMMEQWQQDRLAPCCPNCGEQMDVPRLNWRRHAGLGMTLLEIFNVFPGEAVPVAVLFDRLKEHSGGGWRYFYVQ